MLKEMHEQHATDVKQMRTWERGVQSDVNVVSMVTKEEG